MIHYIPLICILLITFRRSDH